MQTYVYFLQIDDLPQKPVKIGFTTRDVNLRWREHQRTMPFHKIKLLGKIIGNRNDEASLHNLFNESMIVADGFSESEWFYSNDFLNRYIARFVNSSV